MKNYQAPDEKGFFGEHGGLYVSETLIPALQELADAYKAAKNDPSFWEEFHRDLKHYVGRPSPVYHAARLSEHLGGAQIWLKREDLNHTGAHKVNNTIGQALLARRMGKKRVIAETGAGQHGVASATVAARFGMTCDVYMGADDIQRQMPNVFRMKLLGANVVSVDSGSRTLKDAMNEAMREWVARVDDTFYIIGTAAGPAPYPEMVRDFQCVIGNEAKAQMQEAIGRQPDVAVACVGGGSNAIGLFGRGHSRPRRADYQQSPHRRIARLPQLPDAGRKRSSFGYALRFRRLGLPRHRPGTQPPERHQTRRIHRRQRRRSTRSI